MSLAEHARRSLALLLCAATPLAAGCAYDFDAPFGPAQATTDASAADTSTMDRVGDTASEGEAATDAPSDPTAMEADAVESATESSSGPEDCLNGSDDDGNGLVDCQDPLCSVGFRCAPAAPAGWSGPGYASVRSPSSAQPACPFLSQELYGGIQAPPLDCVCFCPTPTGPTCAVDEVVGYGDGYCGIAETSWTSGCQALPPHIATLRPKAAVATPAACPAEVHWVPPWPGGSYTETLDLCVPAAVGGGCDSGGVCVPTPTPEFPDVLCIERAGGGACPGAYPAGAVYGTQALSDTRECSLGTCQCTPPNTDTCDDANLWYYSDGACAAAVSAIKWDSSCHGINAGSIAIGTGSFAGSIYGDCLISGAASPVGGVAPEQPHQVCCVQ